MSADRNLLFGILALQMDFISRDALIRAMNAWVLDKHKPLGQILVEQGALRAGTRAALDLVVQEHLEQHGNDPHRSLAAVNSVGSVRRDLEQVADPDLQASLAQVSAARPGEADPCLTSDYSAGTRTSSGLRFRVLRPHARGGLSEVFVARDEELHREVALKEMQAPLADDPHRRSRFILEAEITGGLEHPGVVPVYGLGTYADGRPFYAMRFIKGDTFQDAIRRFHQTDGPRRDPGERGLALRGLLRRFVDVCNAVAYAHGRGVLHRDLKPSNAILGSYGETLVVDWGLAKPTGRGVKEGGGVEETLRPASAADSAPTRLGSVLGTPGYMSPEQAAGRLEELGPASDVYSLGATLYCLLTGKAPFEGRDVGEVLRKVQKGEFPPPRQVKREVPPALEAVCLKAMALRPQDRYPTARALADDIEKWLADEPVSAWREPLRLRAGRWARRHQTGVAACAAGLLVALLAGGAGAWWLDRQRTEQRRAVETTLEKVGEMQGQARWQEAAALLERERTRLGPSGPADLQARLERAAGELTLVKRLEDIRLKRVTWVIGGTFDTPRADPEYAEAFGAAGLGEVGGNAAAAAAWVRATTMREALVAALDDWAGCARDQKRRAWLLDVARRADPDLWRDGVRDPAVWDDAAALARRVSGEQAARQSPQLLAVLGMRMRGMEAEEMLKRAWNRHPGDFWVNFVLARRVLDEGKAAEAEGYYRVALALRPGTDAAHNNLGLALQHQDKVAEAIAEYRKAIELMPDLDPRSARPHTNLGNALRHQGKMAEAIAEYHKAIELDPKLVQPHSILGVILCDVKGDYDGAIAEFRKAIELDPKDARAHANLGVALSNQGKMAEAIAEYHKAIELDPKLAHAHYLLGVALRHEGKMAETIAEFRKAIELDPGHAWPHNALGWALYGQGKLGEAIGEYRKAIELDPKYAGPHNNLGLALRDQGKLEDAVRECRKAAELDPKNAYVRNSLRECEEMLALDRKYSAILEGKARPADAAEQVRLAGLGRLKKLHAAAAHFYADAFTADPKLADEPRAWHRYNAACCAALAAAGQGEDAARLDDKERARLRQQALGWLRADLALWGKQAESGTPQTRALVQQTLQHWQEDPDLAGLRDAAALAKLPEAERAEWNKLWADVEATLKKAGEGGKP
jgi:serine/threonine-protein kinase